MLSRISILSFFATLAIFLCGECRADSVAMPTPTTPQEQTEIALTDANIPNLTSLLSGKTSLRTPSNSRRSIQRTNSKRFENTQIAIQNDTTGISIDEHSNYAIKSNLLGGVVAEEAFYSLCCLRI